MPILSTNTFKLTYPLLLLCCLLFGLYNATQLFAANVRVSGTVWIDTNQNGKQDSQESGEPFVTVELYHAAGDQLITTTMTDFDGAYAFEGVAEGSYFVKVVLSDYAYGYTTLDRGDDDEIDSDVSLSGESEPFEITDQPVSIDAGFIRILDVISPVQGVVWADENGNGVRDSAETPLENITVTLYFSGTERLFFMQSTTTSADGMYELPGISMGDYLIEFTLPEGAQEFTQQYNGPADSDSDVNPDTQRTEIFYHDGIKRDTQFDAGILGMDTNSTPLSINLNTVNTDHPASLAQFLITALLLTFFIPRNNDS